jgi:hypothetical protein
MEKKLPLGIRDSCAAQHGVEANLFLAPGEGDVVPA